MSLTWPAKDPDEVLDYQVDWSARLASGDSVQSSTWTLDSGLSQNSASIASPKTTIWLSGGTAGKTATIVNRVVTTQGRTMEETIALPIRISALQ